VVDFRFVAEHSKTSRPIGGETPGTRC
jgi:hypothetical protein